MKNLIYLVLLSVTLISCSEEKNLKLIPLTSSSESAIELMRDFMKNSEERRNYLNEKLKFKTFQTMTSMRNVDAECMPHIFSNINDESELN